MLVSESAAFLSFLFVFIFDDTIFEVQLCFHGKEPSKDKAVRQQSALIAVLAMAASFFSFITNTLHQALLHPPAVHSSLPFNDSSEKWPTLLGFSQLFFFFVHHKHTRI